MPIDRLTHNWDLRIDSSKDHFSHGCFHPDRGKHSLQIDSMRQLFKKSQNSPTHAWPSHSTQWRLWLFAWFRVVWSGFYCCNHGISFSHSFLLDFSPHAWHRNVKTRWWFPGRILIFRDFVFFLRFPSRLLHGGGFLIWPCIMVLRSSWFTLDSIGF